jgi:hypothetical protein
MNLPRKLPYKKNPKQVIPVFLFEREVLGDGLHDKVGCGEGGLSAGGQHQLPQSVRHKGVPRLQKRMPKNVVFTGLSSKCLERLLL